MDKDWAGDVKKFVPDADDGVIAGIVRYCGIALQKLDSSLVSYSDPVELGRVRENFLKKKLGLTHSDEELDGAISKVGERLKGVNFKNRVTVYYMLLEHFGLLHLFAKAGTPAATPAAQASATGALGLVAGAGAAVAAGAAASLDAAKEVASDVGDAAADVADAAKATVGAAVAATASGAAASVDAIKDTVGDAAAAATAGAAAVAGGLKSAASAPLGIVSDDDGGRKGGLGWLWLLLIGLLALALLWWLFNRQPAATGATEASTTVSSPAVPDANTSAQAGNATAAAPVIPAGAGVTSEMRDGKPLVKVYFDTGKADVVADFVPASGGLRDYLAANSGSKLGISGYNDPTGNAAANAALSKKRAQAVQAALVKAGVPATSIELIKPEAATDTTVTKEEARRVEVFVK